jgi:hypothetical protein
MEKICKACAADSLSHSFKKISEKRGISVYYTRPSQAKLYNDHDGILDHVDKMLAIQGKRKWMCIIDGEGFETKHAAEVKIGMGILELITEKYKEYLVEIKIVNPSWHVKTVYKVTKPWIDELFEDKITYLDDRAYSVFEFL